MPTASSSSVQIFYPKFDQAYLLRILHERLKILQKELQLLRVVLFGSNVKGNFTVGRDVGFLTVYKGEERTDAYAIVKKSLDIPTLSLIFTQRKSLRRWRDSLIGCPIAEY